METKETALQVLEKNRPTLEVLALAYMPLSATKEEATRKIVREIANVEQWLRTKPDLAACSKDSMVYAVKQCIQDGLTLAPSADLCYLIPGKVKTGQNGTQDIYEWVVNYEPTANGLLSMARQSGRIFDHKRPTCEYDETGAVLSVSVEFLVPSVPSPRWEKITFGPGHFKKWMVASANKNKGNANQNYTSFNGGIDPEFAGTKAIIHGLNKRGMNMGEVSVSAGDTKAASVINNEPIKESAKTEPEFHEFEEMKSEVQPNTNNEIPDLI